MKLVHYNIETHIVFEDNIINTIVVENPSTFYKLVKDLNCQVNGAEGDFVLSQDGQTLKFSNVDILINYFNINLNDRKTQTLLFKKLIDIINNNDICLNLIKANTSIQQLLFNVSQHINLDIAYDDSIDPNALFKAVNIKINQSHDFLIETLIAYFDLLVELKNLKIMCLVNIKSFLSDSDLQKLYQHCSYAKVNLLLLENFYNKNIRPNEKVLIIDKDLCEILVNY